MQSESSAATQSLLIAKFDKALHDRSAFCCGFEPIDNFLKSSLSGQIKDDLCQAWVAIDENHAVLGFYTLGAMGIRPEVLPEKLTRARVPDIPAIYIRAVAITKVAQGHGLGTALVIDAIKRCLEISQGMGAAAIVLDVLKDESFDRRKKFYAKLGFRDLVDPGNPERVYIPMADVRATFEPA